MKVKITKTCCYINHENESICHVRGEIVNLNDEEFKILSKMEVLEVIEEKMDASIYDNKMMHKEYSNK